MFLRSASFGKIASLLALFLVTGLSAICPAGALGGSATISASATVISPFGSAAGDLYAPRQGAVSLEISLGDQTVHTLNKPAPEYSLTAIELAAIARVEPLTAILCETDLRTQTAGATRTDKPGIESDARALVITLIYTEN